MPRAPPSVLAQYNQEYWCPALYCLVLKDEHVFFHSVRLQIWWLRLRWGESVVGAQSEGLHQNSDVLSRANHSPHVRELLAPVQTLRKGKSYYHVKYYYLLLFFQHSFSSKYADILNYLSFLYPGSCEFASNGGSNAGRAALCFESHHSLYDLTNQTSPIIWPDQSDLIF